MFDKALNSLRTPVVWVVAAAQTAFLLWISNERLVARDEGFYLLAARLVAEGNEVYVDFFYPQMPLLPSVYAVWGMLAGFSWPSLRLLSGILAALTGLLVMYRCFRGVGAVAAGGAGVLFCTNALVFPWLPVVKTYALSTMLSFTAYVLLCTVRPSGRLTCSHYWLIAGAGLAAGAAVSTRLLYIALLPLVVIHVWMVVRGTSQVWRGLLCSLLGMIGGLLPVLFAVENPDLFWFNNVEYHMHRSDAPLLASWYAKLQIAGVAAGVLETQKFIGSQMGILLFCALAAICIKRQRVDAAFWYGAALVVFNFLPTPNYVQYFSTIMPFLVVVAVQGAVELVRVTRRRGLPPVAAAVIVLGVGVLYLWPTMNNIEKYAVTGQGVIGFEGGGSISQWRIETLELVAEIVDCVSAEAGPVFAPWPGHIATAHVQPLSGSENQFSRRIASELSARERRQRHVRSHFELRSKLERGSELEKGSEFENERPAMAVLSHPPPRTRYVRTLQRSGYRKVKHIEDARLEGIVFWVRSDIAANERIQACMRRE